MICVALVGGLVVEELPVDHNHGGVIATRVTFEGLQGDLAVLGGLVRANAEMLGEGLPNEQDMCR